MVDEETSKKAACPLCCCGIFVIVFVSLLGSSAKTVDRYHHGLIQNTFSKKVNLDKGVYDSGVYFVGFWNSFLLFPSTIRTISFSSDKPEEGVQSISPLVLRSSDSLPMTLEVSVQYTRKKDELVTLFGRAMNPDLQENLFITELRAELIKVMSQHEARDCWVKRQQLINEFKAACTKSLAQVHAKCFDLQFYRSNMGAKFEEELIKTQVQKQLEKIEKARRDAAEVRAQTEVLLEMTRGNISIYENAERADRYRVEVGTQTQADANKINAEANATKLVLQALALPNGVQMTGEQFTSYQEALMLGAELADTNLFFGLEKPASYLVAPSSRRLKTAP